METTKQPETERRRFAVGEKVWTKTTSGQPIQCTVIVCREDDGQCLLDSPHHGYSITRDPWQVEAGGAGEQSGASEQQPSQAVREQRMVLALEAIYAAMVDMEEFVNSTTTIHYKRRDQLRAKTSAVREAVQAVRQNGKLCEPRKEGHDVP